MASRDSDKMILRHLTTNFNYCAILSGRPPTEIQVTSKTVFWGEVHYF